MKKVRPGRSGRGRERCEWGRGGKLEVESRERKENERGYERERG